MDLLYSLMLPQFCLSSHPAGCVSPGMSAHTVCDRKNGAVVLDAERVQFFGNNDMRILVPGTLKPNIRPCAEIHVFFNRPHFVPLFLRKNKHPFKNLQYQEPFSVP
jgi:hypothetical protein